VGILYGRGRGDGRRKFSVLVRVFHIGAPAVLMAGVVAVVLAACGHGGGSPPRTSVHSTAARGSELPYAAASSLGLTRQDAVRVVLPSTMQLRDGRGDMRASIEMPSQASDLPGHRLHVLWSGTCGFDVPGAREVLVDVNARTTRVSTMIRIHIPYGASECTLTVDTEFQEKPYTGDSATVTVRR
jgi:hypothetical protein